MKTVFYINDEKISRAKLVEMIGDEMLNGFIETAKSNFKNDPDEQNSWYLGRKGMLVIEFK